MAAPNPRSRSRQKRTPPHDARQPPGPAGPGHTEALCEALAALAEEPAPEKLLGRILQALRRQTNARRVSLWAAGEAGNPTGVYVVVEDDHVYVNPEADPGNEPGLASTHEDQLQQEMAVARQPVFCPDACRDPRLVASREHLAAQGITAVLALPLLGAGRFLGSIRAWRVDGGRCRPDEIAVAQALAHQATVAIQLTRLTGQSCQGAILEERNRLARDIHDTLVQKLAGMIIYLEAAEGALPAGAAHEVRDHLRRAGELARLSLTEARRSVRALRPQALEGHAFWTAFEDAVRQGAADTNLRVVSILEGNPRPFPQVWEEQLLRIGQEALANTVQHAGAARFEARLVFAPQEMRLELRDDGTGFDPATIAGGFGLTSMRERAAQMGGTLIVESGPGRGTAIVLRLSLPSLT